MGDLSIPDLDFLSPLTKLRFLEFEGIPDGGWSDKSPLAALTQLERLRMPDPADPIFGDTLVFTPQADPDSWRNWLEAD